MGSCSGVWKTAFGFDESPIIGARSRILVVARMMSQSSAGIHRYTAEWPHRSVNRRKTHQGVSPGLHKSVRLWQILVSTQLVKTEALYQQQDSSDLELILHSTLKRLLLDVSRVSFQGKWRSALERQWHPRGGLERRGPDSVF